MLDFNFSINDAGEYDYITRRIYVNPKKHTSIADIIDTIQHEILHKLLNEEFGTTGDQDHWLIERINMIDEWIIE